MLLPCLFLTIIIGCVLSEPFDEHEFRKALKKEYNFFREIHEVPTLKEDKKLTRSAQLWAEYLSTAPGQTCLHHSLYGGENIYFYYSFRNITPEDLAQKAVRAFYEEIKYYDFGKPGMVWPAAHFTQMTWKSAERMGVGVYTASVPPGETHGGCNIRSSEAFPARMYFVVVHQFPHGNIMTPHHFARNVLRPKNPPKHLDFAWNGNSTDSETTSTTTPNFSTTTSSPKTVSNDVTESSRRASKKKRKRDGDNAKQLLVEAA
ncbi:hypothetical protein PMAYCL1PPCAC_31977 [Pristionchus mayeri]|uniref:SCP domain-containing protein n=1 Tax=Pristionchus mayeri TaxID=1317129 RepID=A0AAN5ID06_9BILA|nr:hypothetical protein PMAYCL1PPCAC_31977 [Pristionchus mayeri]